MLIELMWLSLALTTGSAFFYFAAYTWLCLIIASLCIHEINVRQLYAQFEVEKTEVASGESIQITYRVMNQSFVPAFHVLIQPILSKAFGFDAFDSDTHTLDSYEYKVITRQLVCHRRGFYTLGQVQFQVTDPLGLVTTSFAKSRPIELVVRPKLLKLSEEMSPPLAQQGQKGLSSRRAADRSAIKSVRAYVSGDPMRDIHWKLSARSGTLLVKQFSQSVQSSIWLIVDGCHAVQDEKGLYADHAMDLAHTLIKSWLTQGCLVHVVFTDQRKTRVSGRSLASYGRLLDLLTAFTPDGYGQFSDYMARFLAEQHQAGHVVSISADSDPKLGHMNHYAKRGQIKWEHYKIHAQGGELV